MLTSWEHHLHRVHLQILTDRSQSLPHLEHEAIRLEYDERLTIQLQNCLESCEINLNHTWSIKYANVPLGGCAAVPLSRFSLIFHQCFSISKKMRWTSESRDALNRSSTRSPSNKNEEAHELYKKNQNQNLSICKSLSCPWPRSRPFSFPFWPLMSTEKYCTYHHAT